MSGLNLLVFRGGQQLASGQELKAALVERLLSLRRRCSQDALIDALLLAGELECSMADAGHSIAPPIDVLPMEHLTDHIAGALLSANVGPNFECVNFESLADNASKFAVPDLLSIATPEGFAYYALHPVAYADALLRIPLLTNHLLVVGIRSIGTTLSAVTAAAARLCGAAARRITVRPEGHPYNRHTALLPRQLAIVQDAVSSGATFAIVDEGPGLSGSSFLSVAEALEGAGAPREKIVLLSGHEPNVNTLCAPDAAQRWQRYKNVAVAGQARKPAQAVD
ncbi:MAG TPA: hypothetical protein VH724_00880, partial [Candidatus Angelobacter sp.]|nr:hypothetical protein [Candidatus Angelobacter sp.]